MEKDKIPAVADMATIRTRIYNFRGKNVMIDGDFVLLYQVEMLVYFPEIRVIM